MLGIVVGVATRELISVIHATNLILLLSWASGGVVAGAVQGLFLRPYNFARFGWLCINSVAWFIIGLPAVYAFNGFFSLWLCDNFTRWLFVGLLNGSVVGLFQAAFLRQHIKPWQWVILSASLWTAMWILPLLVIGGGWFFRGEGICI